MRTVVKPMPSRSAISLSRRPSESELDDAPLAFAERREPPARLARRLRIAGASAGCRGLAVLRDASASLRRLRLPSAATYAGLISSSSSSVSAPKRSRLRPRQIRMSPMLRSPSQAYRLTPQ